MVLLRASCCASARNSGVGSFLHSGRLGRLLGGRVELIAWAMVVVAGAATKPVSRIDLGNMIVRVGLSKEVQNEWLGR